MDIEDWLPFEVSDDTSLTPLVYVFAAVPTVLGAAHHIDHIIRGNHVGWPLIPEVNAFTYSLAIYPLIGVSIYLAVSDRVEARYMTVFFAFSAAVLAFFHVSPWAVEPPQDVIQPYGNPVFGYLAFAVLLALIASAVIGCVYSAMLWQQSKSS
ncbi:hypothetical protein [Halobacterium sp. KA-6]|uniref:hypothetical protein n=1 Tax=Halobacterium sp. KA-6 TaxID=2896368 RepID=UPI001E4A14D4|nr:hypothetical protein [Halobacterium sp. KA-6]MCD2204495.1 hypothetical protein [Halobacterium sp. KA-6]